MKKIKDWFIGDYLAKTENVFERAKITLTFYFAIFFMLQAAVMYFNVIANRYWYHLVLISVGWITMAVMLYVIKVKQNIRLAAIIWLFQFIFIGTGAMLIQGGGLDMMSAFWVMVELLFAYFVLGGRWALLATVHVILQLVISLVSEIKFHGTLLDFGIPENLKLPQSPIFMIIPFSLCLFIIRKFVSINKKAEKIVDDQRELLEEKNREVTDSILYAQHIQKAILPSAEVIEQHLPESFLIYKPKSIVSGDFYWLQEKKDLLYFAVGDCTGHGVPGAMMSVIAQNLLNRTIFAFHYIKPSDILDKASELMEKTLALGGENLRDGMDIALCCLDRKTNILQYSGANNPLYIISNNELKEIKANKQPIGKFEAKTPFRNTEIQLQKGDWIYLFSDGMADQFGGQSGKKFKYKALKKLLLELNPLTKHEQMNAISSAFINWMGTNEQVDDVCVFGVMI